MVRLSAWTILMMVALRLVIGWHFFFEGAQKIRSHQIGVTETNKPWTAEGYFRVAEGPARDLLVQQFGDPDQEVLARLKPQTVDGQAELSPARTPIPLAIEWNDYLTRFGAYFKLSNDEKEAAKERVEAVKKEYVTWLVSGKKDVKRSSPNGGTSTTDVSLTTPERVMEFEFKLRELRLILENRLPALGRDVEKKVPTLRGELAAWRSEFNTEINAYTAKVKDTLAALLQNRFSGLSLKAADADIDTKLLRILKPRVAEVVYGKEEAAFPAALEEQWDSFAAFAAEFAPKFDKAEGDRALTEAKRRYVRYLLDRDEFADLRRPVAEVTTRLRAYEESLRKLAELTDAQKSGKALTPEQTQQLAVLKDDVRSLRGLFLADVQRHTDAMKAVVGESLPAEIAKGYAPEEKKMSWLQRSDITTMWVIAVSGACLLLGLFTRLACVVAAGFLILTYLAHPAFPWLPASPMNEGNYVFVNKNLIEAVALLMLATTRSGRWLGLDALIGWLFQGKQKSN